METHSADNFCHRHLLFLSEIGSAAATYSEVLHKDLPSSYKTYVAASFSFSFCP